MRKFLIGAAALALAAGGAMADPGKGGGNGKGNGGGGGKHAAAGPMNPGGGGKGKDHGGADHGPSMKQAKSDRGPDVRADKGDRGQAKRAEKSDRGQSMRAEKADKAERSAARDPRDDKREAKVDRKADRDVRVVRDDRIDRRDRWDDDDFFDRGNRGLVDGCPPGLAKRNNGCTPPGLERQQGGLRLANYRPEWFGLSGMGDGRYFYDEGYLYRLSDQGSVLGYAPLLGGALSIGNPWPSYYDPYPVPDYYERYYNLGSPDSYRFADDVLYRVDPQTDAITSIVALLTGDRFAVGQPLPMGYDVYNVPYEYRDRYADGPDAYYRYADGYVYEVDPTTQLIQAAIELLV